MSKTEEGEEERYFYVGSAILYTKNESGDLLTENIIDLNGQIIASKRFDDDGDPGTTYELANLYFFYHYDVRGSVTAIIRPDGSLIEGYIYDEFGNLSWTEYDSNGDPVQAVNEIFDNEVTYTGSITDTSTGLQYMNARYYDSTTGRFLTQDMYTGNVYEPWTQHLYSYCGNNPTNMVDPTGHKPVWMHGKGKIKSYNDSGTGRGGGWWIDGVWESAWKIGLDGNWIKVTPPDGGYSLTPPTNPNSGSGSGSHTGSGSSSGYSNSNGSLTNEQIAENATIIYNYLRDEGWSHNAACAALGNMQAENRDLNPGRGENGGRSGWGLCQWTPGTEKYLAWASQNGYAADSLIGQLGYLLFSMSEGHTAGGYRQWYASMTPEGMDEYKMLASDFISSNESVGYLTKVFGANYIRSSAMINQGANYDWSGRVGFANAWDEYFS